MFTERTSPSGLILAEQAQDERSIGHALQQIRPDVVLQVRPRDEEKGGVLVYKVVHVESGQVMFTWMDSYGNPLPLSSGIIDEFQRHQLGARNTGLVSDDQHNQRHTDEIERERQRRVEAIRDEHRARLNEVTSVSMNGSFRPRKQGNAKDGPRANAPWRRKA
jgi:hypothetical protein